LLKYLVRAGLDISVENESEDAAEPRGDLRVRYSPHVLKQRLPPIAGNETASLIDEIPVLAVLGSQAEGGLEISDAHELRVKESDRISALSVNLRAMGNGVEEKPDGLLISGGVNWRARILHSGDHRIAMASRWRGLAQRETRIHDAECADVSFPASGRFKKR
jgi:3-phosphoshikimate 1-carboxyvinyltransferase